MPFPNPDTQFGMPNGPDPSESGKKGGASLKKRIKQIKKCTKRCPFYEKCPYVELSKEKFEGYCAVKRFPYRLSQRTLRWLEGDEDALVDNLLYYLIKVETNVDSTNDPNLQIRYLKIAKEVVQMIIGNRIKIQADVNTLTPQQILDSIEEQLKQYSDKKNENK